MTVALKILQFNEGLCSGCRTCELACSLFHEGECNPTLARMRVVDHEVVIHRMVGCRQCEDPPCIEACPVNANQRDPNTGAVTTIDSLCLGCRVCVQACPYEAIWFSPAGKLLRCDLCSGDPQCVRFCATGALTFKLSADHPPKASSWALQDLFCAFPAKK
ncbi:MAG: 4Fe-4S dicluster domain-containing protein [Coprothermobacterota bacterium]|nr:4Fe-4S dicluster domain-containing protein [Coprothermobacterota bacterium]